MADRKSLTLAGRRRSSRGVSVQLEDDISKAIPTDIPQHERLLILVRKCYAASIRELQQNEDTSEELDKALILGGQKIFDSFDECDALPKLIALATDTAKQFEGKADILQYSKELRDLVEENRKWDQLRDHGMSIISEVHPVEAPCKVGGYDYQPLLENARRCRCVASISVQKMAAASRILEAHVKAVESRVARTALRDLSFIEQDTMVLIENLLQSRTNL